MEEEFWRTKSRIQWMHAGDKNMKYFHAKTQQRRRHNRITAIQDTDGFVKHSKKEIQEIIQNYFTVIYSSRGSNDLDSVLQHIQPKVTAEMNQQLTKPVSEEEIFKALSAMNVDKAPGPDGFNAGFYKYHWNTIKSGVVNFVQYFFQSGNLDPDMNHTYICLVPKIESPTQVKDFRPISLCNIAYKLISKVMAERLKLWLHCLISEFQSAFIPGRFITDNVIITHELLHSLRTKKIKSPFMALKLDIAKAFDKVEWNYLLSILRRFGFIEKWCQWIMKCVTTVTYSVLINGSPSKKIIPSRGLRQGDPLSPYLYLLCTEGLSSLLANAVHVKSIHGFKTSRNGPAISHMFFADDSLLFCQANEQECHQILQLLQVYATASGQHVNIQKSAILFGKNVPTTTQETIKSLTGIAKIGGFGRYLGLPEAVGRNKYDAFAYISQRVQHKLDNWYTKFLSQAGKEVLIKSVATALPTYTMSCFLLPKRLISQITAQIRHFRWSNIKEKQKIPWIAWTKLTMMKQYRGMGFRDLSHFNTALLAKQSWRMLKEPHSLLSRVLKAKYFYKTSLMEAAVGHRPSHAWRSIMQGTSLLKQGLKWRIGNGHTVRVWHDSWIDNPPRPPRSLENITNDNLTVSGLMKPCTTSWDEEKLQEKICPEDAQLIRRIRLRLLKGPDVPTWIFTKDGQYTVKSGYHQLSKPHPDCSITSAQLQANIAHRGIKISSDCLFCGDAAETIPHLFFQCRVAKEIWELSPLHIPSDGSWLDPHRKAGIGWALFNAQGRCILKGSSSIDPTSSALETEAIALREALFQLKRLNYQNVSFYGDSSALYNHLEKLVKQIRHDPGPLEIQGYLEDIVAMARGYYAFKHVGRQVNTVADMLARKARWIH